MSKTLVITLNNTGGDQGPFQLSTIDNIGTITPLSGNISYNDLTTGYTLVVNDNIVSIRVTSVNAICVDYYKEVLIPVPGVGKVWKLTISEDDLMDSTGNTIWPDNSLIIEYIDLRDPGAGKQYQTFQNTGEFLTNFCSFDQPELYYYKDDIKVLVTVSTITYEIDCTP